MASVSEIRGSSANVGIEAGKGRRRNELDRMPLIKRQRLLLSRKRHRPSPTLAKVSINMDTKRAPLQASQEWLGLPRGAKFSPDDGDLLWHLLAKVGKGKAAPHPHIYEFITCLDEDDGFGYTHPQKLPGVTLGGNASYFFHRTFKTYRTENGMFQKILGSELEGVFWLRIGKTKPVLVDGCHQGCKRMLVLYMSGKEGGKPEKTNWMMHQYHLGMEEDKEGELVVSKIFYQQRPRQGDKNAQDLAQKDVEAVVEGTAPVVVTESRDLEPHGVNQHPDVITTKASAQVLNVPLCREGRDIGWEHGMAVHGNKFHWKCKWCGYVGYGSGVYRLKQHLAGHRDVFKCPKVPKHIARTMMEHLLDKRNQRRKRPPAQREFNVEESNHLYNSDWFDEGHGEIELAMPVNRDFELLKRATKRSKIASLQFSTATQQSRTTFELFKTDMVKDVIMGDSVSVDAQSAEDTLDDTVPEDKESPGSSNPVPASEVIVHVTGEGRNDLDLQQSNMPEVKVENSDYRETSCYREVLYSSSPDETGLNDSGNDVIDHISLQERCNVLLSGGDCGLHALRAGLYNSSLVEEDGFISQSDRDGTSMTSVGRMSGKDISNLVQDMSAGSPVSLVDNANECDVESAQDEIRPSGTHHCLQEYHFESVRESDASKSSHTLISDSPDSVITRSPLVDERCQTSVPEVKSGEEHVDHRSELHISASPMRLVQVKAEPSEEGNDKNVSETSDAVQYGADKLGLQDMGVSGTCTTTICLLDVRSSAERHSVCNTRKDQENHECSNEVHISDTEQSNFRRVDNQSDNIQVYGSVMSTSPVDVKSEHLVESCTNSSFGAYGEKLMGSSLNSCPIESSGIPTCCPVGDNHLKVNLLFGGSKSQKDVSISSLSPPRASLSEVVHLSPDALSTKISSSLGNVSARDLCTTTQCPAKAGDCQDIIVSNAGSLLKDMDKSSSSKASLPKEAHLDANDKLSNSVFSKPPVKEEPETYTNDLLGPCKNLPYRLLESDVLIAEAKRENPDEVSDEVRDSLRYQIGMLVSGSASDTGYHNNLCCSQQSIAQNSICDSVNSVSAKSSHSSFRKKKKKRTATDSVETALEEDAPGLLQVLLDRGITMEEIKLYGDMEDEEAIEISSTEDSFEELESVITKLFSERTSLFKLSSARHIKGSKAVYCLACLISLIEQARYLQFRNSPVEWGWCRDLQSFIFVFEKHNRIVLERPEYGYATYFFDLVDSLPIDWQIKRLVTAMKLTSCSRTTLIENRPLIVGEDLTEGEARILEEYGWMPNSGLGTMLNYCDRVVHDKKNESLSSEWRAKIGKLLMSGYDSGRTILPKLPEKVEKYARNRLPEIKLENSCNIKD